MENKHLAGKVAEAVEAGKLPRIEEVLDLLRLTEERVSEEARLLKVKGPRLVVCGDIHGDLETVLNLFKRYPPSRNVLVMLGDYVDRGWKSLECACYLLSMKLSYPRNLILLRGNHESPLVNYVYGFYNELSGKVGSRSFELFIRFNEVFAALPYAALLPKRLLLVHGGVPKTMPSLKDIGRLPRKDLIPTNEVAFQLLWNDPSEGVEEFAPSNRSEGAYFYGRKAVERFLKKNRISGIIRSHEAVENGYRFDFKGALGRRLFISKQPAGFEGLVLTLFSSRAYNIPPKAAIIERGSIRIESL